MAVPVKFSADNAELSKAVDDNVKGGNNMAASYRRVNKEASELNRLVARGARENETATSKWKRQTELLNQAFKAGKISQDELQQSLASVNRELDETTRAADSASLSFSGILEKATTLASGAISFTALVAALSKINSQADEAAQSLKELAVTQGQLQQISDSPAETQRLVNTATDLFTTGGLSRAEASQLAFDINSLKGVSDEKSISVISQLASNQLVTGTALSELIQGVAQLNTSFGDSAGGTAAIISKAFAAADKSVTNIQKLLPAVGQAAPFSKQAKISDEETIAAVAELANSFGSAERGGKRFEAFLSVALRKGLTDGTIGGTLDNITKAIKESGKTTFDFIGDKEAVAGFTELQENRKKIELLARNLGADEASGNATLNNRLALFAQAPDTLTAAAALKESEALLEVSKDPLAVQRANETALLNITEAIQREMGVSELIIQLDNLAILIERFVAGGTGNTVSEITLRKFEEAAKTNDRIAELLERLNTHMARIDDATTRRPAAIPLPEAN